MSCQWKQTFCWWNQLIKPEHIAPSAHQLRDAQCWVCASNVFFFFFLNFESLAAKEFCWICCQAPGCPRPPIPQSINARAQRICSNIHARMHNNSEITLTSLPAWNCTEVTCVSRLRQIPCPIARGNWKFSWAIRSSKCSAWMGS